MNLMLFISLLKGNLLNSKFLSLALSIDTFQKAIHISFTRTVRINETLVKHTIAVKTKCSHLLSRTFVIPKRRSFYPPSLPAPNRPICCLWSIRKPCTKLNLINQMRINLSYNGTRLSCFDASTTDMLTTENGHFFYNILKVKQQNFL